MNVFPLVQILFYIAVILAPHGAHMITVSGPNLSVHWTLRDGGWYEKGKTWSVTGETTVEKERGGADQVVDVSRYDSQLKSHDWAKEKVLLLAPNLSLERSGHDFLFKMHADRFEEKVYRISYGI